MPSDSPKVTGANHQRAGIHTPFRLTSVSRLPAAWRLLHLQTSRHKPCEGHAMLAPDDARRVQLAPALFLLRLDSLSRLKNGLGDTSSPPDNKSLALSLSPARVSKDVFLSV